MPLDRLAADALADSDEEVTQAYIQLLFTGTRRNIGGGEANDRRTVIGRNVVCVLGTSFRIQRVRVVSKWFIARKAVTCFESRIKVLYTEPLIDSMMMIRPASLEHLA